MASLPRYRGLSAHAAAGTGAAARRIRPRPPRRRRNPQAPSPRPSSARVKVATWNVNSLRVRLPHLLDWLATHSPDVVCLQETKCEDATFPAGELARGRLPQRAPRATHL